MSANPMDRNIDPTGRAYPTVLNYPLRRKAAWRHATYPFSRSVCRFSLSQLPLIHPKRFKLSHGIWKFLSTHAVVAAARRKQDLPSLSIERTPSWSLMNVESSVLGERFTTLGIDRSIFIARIDRTWPIFSLFFLFYLIPRQNYPSRAFYSIARTKYRRGGSRWIECSFRLFRVRR